MAYNKLIDLNLLNNFLNKIKGLIPTKVSNLENDSGYINEITSSDIITALGYTPSSTDALPLAGGTMSGNINMGSNKVTNLLAPTANGDATSKEYVDNLITIGSTQPTTAQTKIWLGPADTTNPTTEIWVPTISEMNEALAEKEQAGLGISNASVGDFICVSEVDANGKPTSWTRVAQSSIINSSNIVAVSDTQPTATENKLWVDTDAGSGASYQIPTVAEMEAADNTILGNLAMIESSPATTAHAVGDYIVLNGQLYKVTAAIAAGQTLTVGTNISAARIADDFADSQKTYPTVRVDAGTNSYIAYSKIAGLVTLSMRCSAKFVQLTAWQSQLLGTLPTGFRPSIYTLTPASVDRAEAQGACFVVNINGTVYFQSRYATFTDTSNIANATICYVGA